MELEGEFAAGDGSAEQRAARRRCGRHRQREKRLTHTPTKHLQTKTILPMWQRRPRQSVAVIDWLHNHIRSTNKSHDISSRSAGAAASRQFVITISSAARG